MADGEPAALVRWRNAFGKGSCGGSSVQGSGFAAYWRGYTARSQGAGVRDLVGSRIVDIPRIRRAEVAKDALTFALGKSGLESKDLVLAVGSIVSG